MARTNTENLAVDGELNEMANLFEEGFWKGYNSYGEPLPSFYIEKPLYMLRVGERGYWLGREVRGVEVAGEKG